MTRVKKGEIKTLALPEQLVEVSELGGEVLIRGLSLSDRLSLGSREGSGVQRVAQMLALCILDADGEPVFTVEQWEAFGAQYFATTMNLWDVARTLSGMKSEEAEKN